MLRLPTESDIFKFTLSTHAIDRVDLTTDMVTNTWYQRGLPNPYAQGHFRSFMYVMNTLLTGSDFPVKTGVSIQSIQDSEMAMFWLREIHKKMSEPLVNHQLLDEDVNTPNSLMVGRYRYMPSMAVTKPSPSPHLLPKLMHNWLKEYAIFHEKIKTKIDNPMSIDKTTAMDMIRMCREANLFFCTVQPMACMNQRMGRFIENTFRLAWRLPMKFYTPFSEEVRKLPEDVMAFEGKVPALIAACKDVRG